MNINKKLQIGKYKFISNFRIHSSIVIISLFIFFVIIYICSNFVAIGFSLKHKQIITDIYKILDPFLVYLISISWLGLLFSRYISKFNTLRKDIIFRSIFLIFFVGLATTSTYALEKLLFKPFFHVSRPQSRLEKSIIGDYINGHISSKTIDKKLQTKNFLSPIGSIINKNNDNLDTVKKKEVLKNKLSNMGYNDYESKKILNSIIYYEGTYPLKLGLDQKLNSLQQIHKWNSIDPGLWLSNRIINPKETYLEFNSCPSGHGIRQVLVLYLSFLLIFQSRKTRNIIFGTNSRLSLVNHIHFIIFIIFQITAYLWVIYSRIYGFKHTLYDMLISSYIAGLLLIISLMIYYAINSSKIKYFLRTISDLVYETDSEGIISYCNAAFVRMYNLSGEEDVIGKNIRSFYSEPKHRDYLLEELKKRNKVRDYCIVATKTNYKDQKFDFYISVDTDIMEKRRKKIVRGTGRDITDKVKMLSGYFQENDRGIITFCDEQFAKILGYSHPNEVIGKKAKTFWVNPQERKPFIDKLKDYPGKHQSIIINIKQKKDDNGFNIITVKSQKYVLLDHNNQIIKIEGIIEEIMDPGSKSV